jgi:hypothetical protein
MGTGVRPATLLFHPMITISTRNRMKPDLSDASLRVHLTLATGTDSFLVCCPEGAIGLSPRFQPWELYRRAIRPEAARDHDMAAEYCCRLRSGALSGRMVVVRRFPGLKPRAESYSPFGATNLSIRAPFATNNLSSPLTTDNGD